MMRWKIAAGVMALHIIIFAAWAGREECRLLPGRGEAILVRTAPVDPRDLLSGQFIQLRYEFSRPGGMKKAGAEPEVGDDVWVVLAKEGKLHVPKRYSRERPTDCTPDEVVLRGRAEKTRLFVFGVDRWYVPEGTPTPRARDTTVRLRVGMDHRVRIEKVYVKDKPWP